MFQPQLLLHPTDYSDCAGYAFDVAVDLAKHHGARLIVLHVVETLAGYDVTFGEVAKQPQPAGHLEFLHKQLSQMAPSPDASLEVEHLLGEGDPGTAIAQVAAERHCDLIVMGTYGRSALTRLISGSVTQKVSRLAPCAIVTVRMPGPTVVHAT